MARLSITLAMMIGFGMPPSGSMAQDLSPLKPHHVWLPMTGMTNEQIEQARRAGYDTVMLKISPRPSPDGTAIDFAATDELVARATRRGMKVIPAILGWVGLGRGTSGTRTRMAAGSPISSILSGLRPWPASSGTTPG